MNIEVPARKSGVGTWPSPGGVSLSSVSHRYSSSGFRSNPGAVFPIAPCKVFTETASHSMPISFGLPRADHQCSATSSPR